MKPYKLLFILGICMLPSLASCKANKPATTQTYQSQASTTAGIAEKIDTLASWQKLNVPVTLRLKEPKSISVSATATMERGKSVTLSLRFFGMEIGVLHVTTDSILVLDKYNHRYVAEPLSQLLKGIPTDISNIQDMLIGQPFIIGKPKCTNDDFITENDPNNGTFIMLPLTETKGLEYGFSLSPTMSLCALIIKAASGNPITVTYSDPVTSPAGQVASATTIDATTSKSAIHATLDWNFGKAKWDKGVTIRSIAVPANYTRIPSSSILKILSGF